MSLTSQLETLRVDADFLLAREACDVAGGRLLLVSLSEQPSRRCLLEKEYAIRDRLDGEYAARPIELVDYNGREALVCADPGGQVLSSRIGRPWDIGAFLQAGIGITAALGALHARDVIHGDVKPANILVNELTGEAWLLGFGFATVLRRDGRSGEVPAVVAGALPYMAPERTGRTRWPVDFRSDLYSMGVTLYEMLTGSLPFQASDVMEWFHSHLARRPPHPGAPESPLPESVVAIVLKLLSKAPEDRYQTARGVEADLRRCADAWSALGSIAAFTLGADDVSGLLTVPRKLYGRERELSVLLAAAERVTNTGALELVLLAGPSGIGKSALISALEASVTPTPCSFAAGKFDQYKRAVPYATLAQAVLSLVQAALVRSEADLELCRSAIKQAVQQNGQLIVNLVPELELVIGKQEPVPELPPPEARNRFKRLLCRLLAVFATPERPLVLVLDDLQWADPATLDFLEYLSTDDSVRHILVLGAYRDQEVTPEHDLAKTIAKIAALKPVVSTLPLGPLLSSDLAKLLAETLGCATDRVEPFAQIITEKTGGNAFFVRQFLIALHEENLLVFDTSTRSWTWDEGRIGIRHAADVELTVSRLMGLAPATRAGLATLACLGSTASLADLRVVLDAEAMGVHEAFADAVRAGVVTRLDAAYSFQHDRLQQASYELVSAVERPAMHLAIGRALLRQTAANARESQIFEIVNQLNQADGLVSSPDELAELADLNLIAGRRAHAACAYASALTYFAAGRSALAPDCWKTSPRIAFELELHHAECEFLTGDLEHSGIHLSALSLRPLSLPQRSVVTRARITLHTALYRMDLATDVCTEYFDHAGMALSAHPERAEVDREFACIWEQLAGREIETLRDLPAIEDPDLRGSLAVLCELQPIASFTERNLGDLVVGRMVNLSLRHGHWDGSALIYLQLVMVLSSRELADHATVLRFARLGWELAQRAPRGRFYGRFLMIFAGFVSYFIDSAQNACALLERACELALDSGDVTFALYSRVLLGSNRLAAGHSLREVEREYDVGLELGRRFQLGLYLEATGHLCGFLRMLRGETAKFGRLDDGDSTESAVETALEQTRRFDAAGYWTFKLMSRVLAGEYATALESAEKSDATRRSSPMLLGLSYEILEYHFFAALAHAGRHDEVTETERPAHVAEVARHHAQLAIWARSWEENFSHRACILAAELARVEGRLLDAEGLFEQGIRLAREAGCAHVEGIGAERAALFYLGRRLPTLAQTYLRVARSAYTRWGADGKVRQLDRLYPELRELTAAPAVASSDAVEGLDVAAALKMSQAVSSEIELGALIDRLMTIALEHAGAERAVLIRPTEGGFHIEAEAKTTDDGISVECFPGDGTRVAIPDAVVRFVLRKREAVILDDALLPNLFSADPYIAQLRVRSVLCLPLMKQAKLSGVLYLENGLTPHVFTPARIAMLGMLASQAAISLENAHLVLELREENRIRHQTETELTRSEAYSAEAQTLSRTGIRWAREAEDGPLASFGWNVSTKEFFASGETCRLLGFDPKVKPTLDQVSATIHPDDRAAVATVFEGAVTKPGVNLDYEHRVVMPDGLVKRVHVVARSSSNARGEIELVGAAMDVTAQRQAEADLERSEEALNTVRTELARVARVTSLGVLAASIAHEVNQPLSGLVTNGGTCQRMLAAVPPNLEGARQTAERIVRDANRAADIVMRLRTLFNKKGSTSEILNLNEATGEVLALMLRELQRNRVIVTSELALDLPLVRGDRVQLQQVFLNLLLNASDAMNQVDERPRHLLIKTEAEPGARVRLSVRDAGIGFDPAVADRLFEAFYTSKAGGMGIGLSVSRSIIENHHGSLRATRNDGPGATFSFSIPAAAAGDS
jgi:predicted ATPase/C4-dicarboxylate-specific signal transduction histidine kinase